MKNIPYEKYVGTGSVMGLDLKIGMVGSWNKSSGRRGPHSVELPDAPGSRAGIPAVSGTPGIPGTRRNQRPGARRDVRRAEGPPGAVCCPE